MGYDNSWNPFSTLLGIADGFSVCGTDKETKQSISMWNYHKSFAAQTIAHEMGHNLGMYHDFDKQ